LHAKLSKPGNQDIFARCQGGLDDFDESLKDLVRKEIYTERMKSEMVKPLQAVVDKAQETQLK
jgi:hypothetical protein